MALAMRAMNYRDDCCEGTFSVFRVERVLKALLDSEVSLAKAAAELAAVRDALLRETMLVRVAGDIVALNGGGTPGIFSAWQGRLYMPESGASPRGPAKQGALQRDFLAADAVRPGAGPAAGCLLSSP